MFKTINENSIDLIKKYQGEIGLIFPLDEESRVAILSFFESLDADIGG